jgi:predicted phage terminase large subunit-like protein
MVAERRGAVRPQDGPQMDFLASKADIAIYGGAAGGGKTWALLIEPVRHIANGQFGAVFFRRTLVQVRHEGGLWDESVKLYLGAGGVPKEHGLEWRFPSGASISFAHLEHDKTVFDWQGSQIPLICFDELTHFSSKQFWYMVSRNRSMCGVRPYIRATCNPDADSWVAEFIAWWIDPDTGFAIPERAGVLRWFVRDGEAFIWANQPDALAGYTMSDEEGRVVPIPPKSVTFIPARLTDNKALMAANPDYQANLLALPPVERERLLSGNWKIRPAAGLLFKREWCEVVDALPADLKIIRGWDLAATPKTAENDPEWTAGTKIGHSSSTGYYYVIDHKRLRDTAAKVEELVRHTASADGRSVTIALPEDPGQAGKSQVHYLTQKLAGYPIQWGRVSGDKEVRFRPFSAQAQVGNVKVLRNAWNDAWWGALEAFPGGAHDDDVDSTSEAFNAFLPPKPKPARQVYIGHMGR